MNGLSELRRKELPNPHTKDLRSWTQLVLKHLASNLNLINIVKYIQDYHKSLYFSLLCTSQMLCTLR